MILALVSFDCFVRSQRLGNFSEPAPVLRKSHWASCEVLEVGGFGSLDCVVRGAPWIVLHFVLEVIVLCSCVVLLDAPCVVWYKPPHTHTYAHKQVSPLASWRAASVGLSAKQHPLYKGFLCDTPLLLGLLNT